jgi:hypothetical protein
MRLVVSVLVVVFTAAGCSDSAPSGHDQEAEAIGEPCDELPGSAWRSLEELVGGELPGGGHGMEHWGIEFTETTAMWTFTDTGLSLSYSCTNGAISAGEPWREIEPQFVISEEGALLLEWEGELYEQIRLGGSIDATARG